MKAFTVRFDDDVDNELETLANLLGMSKNQVLTLMIRTEYNKYAEDPKVKKAFEQFNEMKSMFERFAQENAK